MDAVTSGLNTEIFSAEREWTVEGLPVLTAQVSGEVDHHGAREIMGELERNIGEPDHPAYPAVLPRPVPGLSPVL